MSAPGSLFDDVSTQPPASGDPEALRVQVEQLRAELEAANRNVERLDAAVRRKTPRIRPSTVRSRRARRTRTAANWWDETRHGPERRDEMNRDLHGFGQWVIRVYVIDHYPSGWMADAALRAEMLALFAGWQGAYTRHGAGNHEPGQWHDALDRSLHRTREYMARKHKTTVAAANTGDS